MRKPFYDSPWFLNFAPLLLLLASLLMTDRVHKSMEAAASAEERLQRQVWCQCGKPWGEPCDCPTEGCLCGIVKGRSCGNCRPMK